MNVNTLVMRYPNGLNKALTLSYDDGVVEDIRLIDIMKAHGLKGTFNVNTGRYAAEGAPRKEPYANRLTYAEVSELYNQEGIEIAIHGYSHASLPTLPPLQATVEVLRDRENLEAQFDREVRGMAYAYGSYDDKTVQVLRDCGVLYCRTVISTEKFDLPTDWLRLPATCHHKNPRLLELTEKFLNTQLRDRDNPWLFYLWGHSYEFERDQNWEIIENFASKIGNREDIWYATNSEIFEYIEDFQRLRFDADMTRVINPTARPLWFIVNKQSYCVRPGETLKL